MRLLSQLATALLLAVSASGATHPAQQQREPGPVPAQNREQLTISPSVARVSAGDERQFGAAVNGTATSKVSWTVTGEGCSGDACGTITRDGLYTAPIRVPTPPTIRVTAASDGQELTASATVTLVPLVIARPGVDVTPPRAIHTTDPEYSPEARDAKYEGTCVLWVIVGSDGKPQRIRVAKGLGMGLDEKAIEAVKQWTFRPATKEGKPVAFQINVEVHFRLTGSPP